jgi:hypothetical protein
MKSIFTSSITDWQDLQNKVCQIFKESDLIANTDVPVKLVRGQADMDVVAEDRRHTPPIKIFAECKHWKNNVPQQVVHGFRTIMSDGGAHAGYIISSSGFQSGAFEAAKDTNVQLVDWEEFQNIFYQRWFDAMKRKVGIWVDPICEYFDPFGKIMRGLDGTSERVLKSEKLHNRYEVFMKASPFLNNNPMNPKFTMIQFPMTVNDPGGDLEAPAQIVLEHPRQFFDLIVKYRDTALQDFVNFTTELKVSK